MSQIPAGRYPIRPTQRDLQELKESILGVATPETLDTLSELAAALGNDPQYFTTIADQVSELNTDVTDVVAALGIAENDNDVGTFTSPTLPDGTTLRAVLEAFAGAYDTTKSNLEGADAALSGRLDTLETDPVTQAYVDSADSALSGRLDVLEADPTTATAVAAVQSDVDSNQTASESADAALSGRLDTLEADPTTQAAVDLKANKAGDTFTGDVIIDEGTGSTIKLETTDATSAGIHIEGPTGSYIWIGSGPAPAEGMLHGARYDFNDEVLPVGATYWAKLVESELPR